MELTSKNVDRLFAAIEQKAVKLASRRALERAIGHVRTEAVKAVKDQYPTIKPGEVKKAMKVIKPKIGPIDKMVGELQIWMRGIPLIKFAGKRVRVVTSMMRANGKGVRKMWGAQATVKRGAKTIKGAFIVSWKGQRGIVSREKGAGRYPLRQLVGPGVIDVFKDKSLNKRLLEKGRDFLKKNFANEFRFYFDREVKRKFK